jgi:hypothetical protein
MATNASPPSNDSHHIPASTDNAERLLLPRAPSRRFSIARGPTVPRPPERSAGAIWEPGADPGDRGISGSDVLRAPAAFVDPELEHAIIAVLTRPIDPTAGHQVGNARRELELRALFATLDPAQALSLRRRLDRALHDDVLVQAFNRMLLERRHRLLAFLADAPRRRALQLVCDAR